MELDCQYHTQVKQAYLHQLQKFIYIFFSCSTDKKNLLSISQLTKDDSCIFEFSSSQFKIKEQGTEMIIATGSWRGDL